MPPVEADGRAGDQWINELAASSFKDIEDSPDNVPRFNVQIARAAVQ